MVNTPEGVTADSRVVDTDRRGIYKDKIKKGAMGVANDV